MATKVKTSLAVYRSGARTSRSHTMESILLSNKGLASLVLRSLKALETTAKLDAPRSLSAVLYSRASPGHPSSISDQAWEAFPEGRARQSSLRRPRELSSTPKRIASWERPSLRTKAAAEGQNGMCNGTFGLNLKSYCRAAKETKRENGFHQ